MGVMMITQWRFEFTTQFNEYPIKPKISSFLRKVVVLFVEIHFHEEHLEECLHFLIRLFGRPHRVHPQAHLVHELQRRSAQRRKRAEKVILF